MLKGKGYLIIALFIAIAIGGLAYFRISSAQNTSTSTAPQKTIASKESETVKRIKASLEKVPVTEARTRLLSQKALLVGAYKEGRKFNKFALEGAISLTDLREMAETIPKDKEIIFYCACRGGGKARTAAVEFLQKGHINVKILDGGTKAWQKAGFPTNFKRRS